MYIYTYIPFRISAQNIICTFAFIKKTPEIEQLLHIASTWLEQFAYNTRERDAFYFILNTTVFTGEILPIRILFVKLRVSTVVVESHWFACLRVLSTGFICHSEFFCCCKNRCHVCIEDGVHCKQRHGNEYKIVETKKLQNNMHQIISDFVIGTFRRKVAAIWQCESINCPACLNITNNIRIDVYIHIYKTATHCNTLQHAELQAHPCHGLRHNLEIWGVSTHHILKATSRNYTSKDSDTKVRDLLHREEGEEEEGEVVMVS